MYIDFQFCVCTFNAVWKETLVEEKLGESSNVTVGKTKFVSKVCACKWIAIYGSLLLTIKAMQ